MQRGAPFGFAIPRSYKRLLILVHFLVIQPSIFAALCGLVKC